MRNGIVLLISFCILTVNAFAQEDSRLIFWNKLDSQYDVLNCEVGPGGNVTGALAFSPAQFGRGATNADVGSYLAIENTVFNPGCGTIEFWFKTDFDVSNGCSQDGGLQKWWVTQSAYTETGDYCYFFVFFDDAGHSGRLGIGMAGQDNQGVFIYPYFYSNNGFDWKAGELHHFAISYDRAGFDSGKTLAVFLDGKELVSSSADWGVYNKGTVPLVLNNNIAQMRESHTVLDNIKIWNYAKNNFSDRFTEDGTLDWPMFHYNADRDGHYRAAMPVELSLLWSYPCQAAFSSAAIADGRVFIGSEDDGMYALDEKTGGFLWRFATGANVLSSPAYHKGRVFIGSEDSYLYCIDAVNGTLVWNFPTGNRIFCYPLVDDGKVFVGSEDGKLYCIDELSGAMSWSYQTGAMVFSAPAATADKVFFGSYDFNVYCLNKANGSLLWMFPTGHNVYGAPVVNKGRVYIGSQDMNMYCLDEETGNKLWNFAVDGAVYSTAALAHGKLIFTTTNGWVYCLNETDGTLLWNTKITDYSQASPAVSDDGKVYVSAYQDRLCVLDENNGAILWSYPIPGNLASSPVLANSKVFIGAGNLLAFGKVENQAPVASDIAVTTNEDAAQDITLQASDAENDVLTCSILQQPAHGVVALSGGVATYTPSVDYFGNDTFTYKANDGKADSNTAVVSLNILPVNDAPSLNPIGNKRVNEANILTFEVTATDVDDVVLNFSATGLPEGATFNAQSRVFNWIPSYTQAGTYSVTFTVSDAQGAEDSETINITVGNLNRPPVARLSARFLTTNQVVFSAAGSSDPDGDSLTYYWIFGDGISQSTNFSFVTHRYVRSGWYNVIVIVRDSYGLGAAAGIRILVNMPPVIRSVSVAVEDVATRMYSFNVVASDIDGYVVEYEWLSSRDGYLSNERSFRRQLSRGFHIIRVRAKDNYNIWSRTALRVVFVM